MSLLLLFRPTAAVASEPTPTARSYQTGTHQASVVSSSLVSAFFVAAAALVATPPTPASAETITGTHEAAIHQSQNCSKVFAAWSVPIEVPVVAPTPSARQYTTGTHAAAVIDSQNRSSIFPVWTYVTQPDAAGAEYQTGTHELVIHQAQNFSWVHGKPPPTRVAPPIRSFYNTDGQVPEYNLSKVIRSQVQPYPTLRRAIVTQAELPQYDSSSVKKAWIVPPLPPGAAPLRPAIYTQAEIPQQQPQASVYSPFPGRSAGDKLTTHRYHTGTHELALQQSQNFSFVKNAWVHATTPPPAQPKPGVAEYVTGQHDTAVFSSQNRSVISKAWLYGNGEPPVVTEVPGKRTYETGTHQAAIHQSQMQSAFWNTTIIGVRVTFVSQEPSGEGEDPRYQPSGTWGREIIPAIYPMPVQPGVAEFQYGTHEVNTLDSQNSTVFWNTVMANYREIWITPEVYGEGQEPPYQESQLLSVYQTFIDQLKPPTLRPLIATLPQSFENQQGTITRTNIPILSYPLTALPYFTPTWGTPQQYEDLQANYHPTYIVALEAPGVPTMMLGDYQEFENQQGSISRTLIQQFQTPPNRPKDNLVVAEEPLQAPSFVKGSVALYAELINTKQKPLRGSFLGTLPTEAQFLQNNASFVKYHGPIDLPDIPNTVVVSLTGIQLTYAQGVINPGKVVNVGRIVTLPKYIGATELLMPPFNFSGQLAAGETLLTASVVASVYSGTDAVPAAILSGAAAIDGAKVNQMMTGGTLGVVYELLCTVTTTEGQTLQESTYFYVEPDLP